MFHKNIIQDFLRFYGVIMSGKFNTEFNNLRISICLRKSEVSVERN